MSNFSVPLSSLGGGGLDGVTVSGDSTQRNYLFNNASNLIEFAGLDADCYGNTISGGGNSINKNIIYGDTSLRTISGGYNNIIGIQGTTGTTATIASTISGGAHNRIALNADNNLNTVTPAGSVNPDHGTISGGSYNTIANGSYGTISGGNINTIYETNATTSTGQYASIGGGVLNVVSGTQGTIAGGNTNQVLCTGGMIGGGNNNTIAGPVEGATGKNASVIAGGSTNIINCSGFASITGGLQNQINSSTTTDLGSYSTICGGFSNYIGDGVYSVFSTILGGQDNRIKNQLCIAGGKNALASAPGQFVIGGTQFAARGDAQSSLFVIKALTTSGTPVNMGTHGATVDMPVDTTWAFRCLISARNTNNGVSESAAYEIVGCIDRPATGTARLVGTPTVTTIAEDTGAAPWSVAVSAGSFNLVFTVTGEASKTIRWVGRLETAEVSG